MPFDIKQASEYASLDEAYLRKLIREKKLAGNKSSGKWVIHKKDLDTYLNKNKPPVGYIDAFHAARMSGLAKNSILGSIKANRLPATKVNDMWVIKIKDLKKYIDGRKVTDGFISFRNAAKKLQVSTSVIGVTVRKCNIKTKKAGRELTISKKDFKQIKGILESATPGRKTECATIYFRKFGRRTDSGISGPFLEARSGTHEFGRKILCQIPLKNIRLETVEKAKSELIKIIEDIGITNIYDKIVVR